MNEATEKARRGNVVQICAENIARQLIKIVESKYFLVGIFIWFVIQGIYMAFTTKFAIPPDERYHFVFIKACADNGLSPFFGKQDGFFTLGEIQHNPYFLYHYLLSIPYHLFEGQSDSFRILRLLNIPLGCGSLFVTYLIAKELDIKPFARNVAIFIFGNTLMFVFLSASINYDNLMNLLSLSAILLMLRLWKQFNAITYLSFLVVLLAGMLTKMSFLPVLVACVALLLLRNWRKPWIFFSIFFKMKWTKSAIVLTAILFLLLAPVAQRYVVNLVEYRTLQPACDQVLSKTDCMKNVIYARGVELDKIQNPIIDTSKPAYLMSWTSNMGNRAFGILGHKSIPPLRIVYPAGVAVLVCGLLSFLFKVKRSDVPIFLAMFVSGAYLLALIRENYSTYLATGDSGLSVQGRYAFPVYSIILLVLIHYIFRLLSNVTLKACCATLLCAVFFASSLPTFIRKTLPNESWHKASSALSGDAPIVLKKSLKANADKVQPWQ